MYNMEAQIAQFTNRGMNQDISVSKATNEFAFKNYNIRITAVNDNTLLSITNEKLPTPISIELKQAAIYNKLNVSLKGAFEGNKAISKLIVSSEYTTDTQIQLRIEVKSYEGEIINLIHDIPAGIKDYEYSFTTRYKALEKAVINSVGGYNTAEIKYSYYTQFETKPSFKFLNDTLNYIPGIYLGHAIINNNLVLFTHEDGGFDYIISLQYNEAKGFVGKTHYIGNLNFSAEHPIETLPYYESEDVQKVYWVDGYNQPRVINIASESIIDRLDTQFDFNPTISKFPEVSITKEYDAIGLFPAGVIQYFISYYNKYGAETGIIYSTSLNYITDNNRGLAPDEIGTCSFKIHLNNVDTSFEYVRVYSLIRTSLNATPICSIVSDVKIVGEEVVIVDANTNNSTIDSTALLFLGGDNFTASTLTQKDDTLFLGDINLKTFIIDSDIKEAITQASIGEDGYTSKIVFFDNVLSSEDFQLNNEESVFKTFKSGERYRFAIQFQTKELFWSDPIWIGDKTCDVFPKHVGDKYRIPKAYVNLPEGLCKTYLKDFDNYRILIAEPSFDTRSIIAQGIVSPTVFNFEQRVNKTGPYSQASWILRPQMNKWVRTSSHLIGLGNDDNELRSTAEIQNSIEKNPFEASTGVDGYILSFSWDNTENIVICDVFSAKKAKDVNYYDISEDNIEEALLEGQSRIIRGIKASSIISRFKSVTQLDNIQISEEALQSYINRCLGGENFTGNSIIPDSDNWYVGHFERLTSGEFSKFTDNIGSLGKNCWGYTFIYADVAGEPTDFSDYVSNYYIDSNIVTFHSPDIDSLNTLDGDDLTFRIVGAVPIKEDRMDVKITTTTSGHSGTSAINKTLDTKEIYNNPLFRDSIIENNKIDDARTGYYYMFLWQKDGSIIGVDSNTEHTDGTVASNFADLKNKTFGYFKKSNNTLYFDYFENPNAIQDYDITLSVYDSNFLETKAIKVNNKNAYYWGNCDTVVPTTDKYKVWYKRRDNGERDNTGAEQSSPVSIKYKTKKHGIFSLRIGNQKYVLPDTNSYDGFEQLIKDYYNITDVTGCKTPWDDNAILDEYKQKSMLGMLPDLQEYTYFILGEIRRNIPIDVFCGGKDNFILTSLNWIPVSASANIGSITYAYGDTYYQRWNLIHSLPFTEEDQNSVIDTVSFMVETRTNLLGDYSKINPEENTLNIREDNTNKINPVYSQSNNYFTYNILDEKFNQTKYRNQVAFSLQKTPTSEVDTWCNISLASAFNLNGLYGKLNKLITVNDNIIAFQDKAISVINFNNRTALSTESGIPIEIANSGKVNGYSIISSNIGCQNKKSICEASSGVYFIDDYNKTMYGFNREGLASISSSRMSMWFKNNLTGKEQLFYDSLTNDVYITNDKDCLVYNEGLQSFTSFMDYNNIYSLFNFNSTSILLDNVGNIIPKKMFGGDYTSDYSIEYKINPEPLVDKTFGNIEFIADCFNPTDYVDDYNTNLNGSNPFTLLNVWNEYQKGSTLINTKRFRYPNFEKKFRVWRVDIPRDETNGRDRIRNPWVYLKLSKSEPSDKSKMVFHNLIVKYYK